MSKVHAFEDSLAVGQAGEAALDEHYRALGFEVEALGAAFDRRGVDRLLRRVDDGATFLVDYKVDTRAQDTERVFVELESSETRAGWALTGWAQMVAYFVPARLEVVEMDVARLRAVLLPLWRKRLTVARARNDGYASTGLLVPWLLFASAGRVRWYAGSEAALAPLLQPRRRVAA